MADRFSNRAGEQPEDPLQLVDSQPRPGGRGLRLGIVRDQVVRRVRLSPKVRMVPSSIMVDGRRLFFAVSDNDDAYGPDGPASPPVWAVNIHGYFASGGMYWRESARLAEALGWRVINPSLPGFGGSDSLEWRDVSVENLANQLLAIVHSVGAGPVVLLGHSMGGAVAVQFAHDHPRRTLGVIYRDGVSTPAWKERTGIIPTLLSPILPDVAPMVDIMAAAVFDLPDLLIGRMYSTMRALWPDVRQNIRSVAETLPVGSMLMTLDQRSQVRALVAHQIPLLNEWGCFDRITPGKAALEFAAIARAPVQWVPGGHSWMLARPQGQADILTYVPSGREFKARMEDRWRQFTTREHTLRAVN
jgi:pimeloyl-ACP methyl ester carboxylesterase